MDMIKRIPTHMDYVGQGRAEKLYQIIIGSFSRLSRQEDCNLRIIWSFNDQIVD